MKNKKKTMLKRKNIKNFKMKAKMLKILRKKRVTIRLIKEKVLDMEMEELLRADFLENVAAFLKIKITLFVVLL